MADTPVLAAGQVRDVTLDGVTYTLRPLTHGEHVMLQAAGRAVRAPSRDLIEDLVMAAARQADREDLAAAIATCQEAEDNLSALFASMPPGLDEEGQARWRAEHHAEQQAIEAPLYAAQRKRRLAMELFGAEGKVAEMQRDAEEAQVESLRQLVRMALVQISRGPQVDTGPFVPHDVAALPSAHVQQLALAASELLKPSADSAKN